MGGNAYILRDGEAEAPPEIVEIWRHAMFVRALLQARPNPTAPPSAAWSRRRIASVRVMRCAVPQENVRVGQTAGATLALLVHKLEEAGYCSRTEIVQGWPKLWANFRALPQGNRDLQSNCWAKSRNLAQPCTIFVISPPLRPEARLGF
jgi:hypothetical protein